MTIKQFDLDKTITVRDVVDALEASTQTYYPPENEQDEYGDGAYIVYPNVFETLIVEALDQAV